MYEYIILLMTIVCDFLLEYVVNSLTKNKPQNSFINILNCIFKCRLITIAAFVCISTFKPLTVGLDTMTYFEYYESLRQNRTMLFKQPISSKWEIGYTALNSILAFFGCDFKVLLLVISLFVAVSLTYFINKLSTNKLMSMVLYVALGVLAQSLSAMRQIIAMSIILFVIVLLLKPSKHSLLKSILLIFIACMFHISAICCLVLIPLKYIKPNLFNISAMSLLTIIGSYVFPYAMKIIEKITPLKYYSRYFIDFVGYLGVSNLLNNLYSISLIAIFLIFVVARNTILNLTIDERQKYDYYLMIFMLVPLIRIAGFMLNAQELFQRLSMYFFPILIVLIPQFVKGLKFNLNLYYTANIGVYVVAAGYMYYLYAIKQSCGVVPY